MRALYTNTGCPLQVVGQPHDMGGRVAITLPTGDVVEGTVTDTTPYRSIVHLDETDTDVRLFVHLRDCPDRPVQS